MGRTAILCFLLMLVAGRIALADPPRVPGLRAERVCSSLSVLQKLHRDNEGVLLRSEFADSRPFSEYKATFGERFEQAVETLGPDDHWVDGGAGLAVPMTELLSGSTGVRYGPNGPQMTAITIVRPPPTKAPHDQRALDKAISGSNDKFRYLEGRDLRSIPLEELRARGSVTLITDLYGAASYDPHLDLILEYYGNALAPGGRLFLAVEPNEPFLRIRLAGGREITLDRYLSSIRGFKLLDRGRASRSLHRYELVRTQDPLRVPPLLLSHFTTFQPPFREYLWQRPPVGTRLESWAASLFR